MKKIANFIINKRNYILCFMLAVCIGCAFLIPSVTVNKDLTKYLPDSSPMKEGLEIMEKEFPDSKMPGTLRVMFEDLEKEEIPETLEKLKAIPNTSGVFYDDSKNFNKGNHTLFCLNSDYEYGSEEMKAVISDINREFKDRNIIMHHTAESITAIPFWIFIIVGAVLIIILFFMCPSYTEPFVFLATIGMAIVINLGSNIILGSISETTFSIAAVLQLALSMDYSIILMNRYRQEKAKNSAPAEAMKKAFISAFPSIIGSGMTTVIGLLMLSFMRFKIGMDLGFCLAKGVAISMLCVLLVLPALILIFDKLIEKTAKKELHIPTDGIAKISFSKRKIIAAVFAVLFIGTALLQNITGITFSQLKRDEIEDVFPQTNPVIMLYENKDEGKVAELYGSIKSQDKVTDITSYSTTLGNRLTVKEMGDALKNLGSTVDTSLLPIVYYHYNSGDKYTEMTLLQFTKFLKDDILPDERLSSFISSEEKAKLEKLLPYADKVILTESKSSADISKLIGIDESKTDLIYVLKYSANPQYTPENMTVQEFANFIKTDIADNPLFASKIDANALKQLESLSPLLDKNTITAPVPPEMIAESFNLDVNLVKTLFAMKLGAEAPQTMSIYDFAAFITDDVMKNPQLSAKFDKASAAKLTVMKSVMDAVISEKKLSPKEISAVFGMKESDIKLLYTYRSYGFNKSQFKMSLSEFVNFTADKILPDEQYAAQLPQDSAKLLKTAQNLINAALAEKPMSSEYMANFMGNYVNGITKEQIDLLFLLNSAKLDSNPQWTMSVSELVNHITEKILPDSRFSMFIDEKAKESLLSAKSSLEESAKMLKSKNYSLAIIETKYPQEGKQTTEFIDFLNENLENNTSGKYYLIGNSAMNVEMEKGFGKDLILITVLTAAAIFAVVAITFRKLSVPLLLVLIVQCGVFVTVTFSGLIGHDIYYLALLIVQCILMGATIDYGIVYTNYYIENRREHDVPTSVTLAYRQSIHTVLTSGLIIVLITGVIGISPADPSITQICQTLAVGALAAILLILFVLPGLLAAFDKSITKEHSDKN